MSETNIQQVGADSPYVASVKEMLKDLFSYLSANGILMPLTANGEEIWFKSIEKTIDGKFGILLGAFTDSTIAGFVHCMIRFAPAYLGTHKVGYISQLYVNPIHRKTSVGRLLVKSAEEWFKSKNVHSFELSVHATNSNGIRFWKKMGFADELIQMRKFPE